jgi:hypothetical protein
VVGQAKRRYRNAPLAARGIGIVSDRNERVGGMMMEEEEE